MARTVFHAAISARIARTALTVALLAASSLAIAGTPDFFSGALEHAALVDTLTLKGEVFHVQGIAIDKGRIWITSVDGARHRGFLHEFDAASGRFLRRLELTDGKRYHPGGVSIANGAIWVPVAELRPNSSATLVEIDTETLAVKRRIAVADHIGCIASNGRTLVAGNWDSRLLYVFDLAGHAAPRVVPNPSATHFQDIKFVGRHLVAGGNRSWWNGTLDWIDFPSMTVTRSLRAGAANPVRAWTGEGMAIEGRELYLLPEDGPARVFHFRLDRAAVA